MKKDIDMLNHIIYYVTIKHGTGSTNEWLCRKPFINDWVERVPQRIGGQKYEKENCLNVNDMCINCSDCCRVWEQFK